MNTSWHSYPKIYALGHKNIDELLFDEVLVEEKIDGSQISFGRFNGELKIRSKGADIIPDAPPKMFAKGVEIIKTLDLHDGWTYRGEYLDKPKHNALAYDRIPNNHIIIFDINVGEEDYISYSTKVAEAHRLGFETVPRLFYGTIGSANDVLSFLETPSILGGQKIEGVVIKNYKRFSLDKKVMIGKFVSESFKEVHRAAWKESNPTKKDVVDQLIEQLKTPARWNKAIQHLREAGTLTDSPKDIGNLIKEIQSDTIAECKDEIMEALYKHAIEHIKRGIIGGFPEWYKEQLMNKQFDNDVQS